MPVTLFNCLRCNKKFKDDAKYIKHITDEWPCILSEKKNEKFVSVPKEYVLYLEAIVIKVENDILNRKIIDPDLEALVFKTT
jgi:uncharacterized C2H2 Zn-finger protein